MITTKSIYKLYSRGNKYYCLGKILKLDWNSQPTSSLSLPPSNEDNGTNNNEQSLILNHLGSLQESFFSAPFDSLLNLKEDLKQLDPYQLQQAV